MSDPTRWRDAPHLAPLGVGELLAKAKRTRTMTAAEHAQSALALGTLAAPATAAAGAPFAAKLVAHLAGPRALTALIAGVVSAGVVVQSRSVGGLHARAPVATEVSEGPRRAETHAPRTIANPTLEVRATPEALPAERQARPGAAPVRDPAPSPEPSVEPPPLTARPDSLAREFALVEGARRALAGDPAQALREADAHAAEFPSGELSPERELIAIEALAKLRRAREARARAEAFLARDPRGIYRARAVALLRGLPVL